MVLTHKENPYPKLNAAIEGVLYGHAVPQALVNTSVAKLYALYAEKPNFRLRYDSILAELERLETTLHDPLPEGDIRRDRISCACNLKMRLCQHL